VNKGQVIIWAASRAGTIDGTVQLRLEQMPNGRHRAQIAKLVVRRRARRVWADSYWRSLNGPPPNAEEPYWSSIPKPEALRNSSTD
jgi:hypothetical protein